MEAGGEANGKDVWPNQNVFWFLFRPKTYKQTHTMSLAKAAEDGDLEAVKDSLNAQNTNVNEVDDFGLSGLCTHTTSMRICYAFMYFKSTAHICNRYTTLLA